MGNGLSQYFETGCPNRGFIDFCVSKVWYKVHTTIKNKPYMLKYFSNWGKRINRCEVRGAPPYLIKYIESHWGGGTKPMDP